MCGVGVRGGVDMVNGDGDVWSGLVVVDIVDVDGEGAVV